jgi:hypothetical protein
VGELPVPALTGEKYWVTAVDEFSHFIAAIPVKSKAEIPKKVKDLLVFWTTQLGIPVERSSAGRGKRRIDIVKDRDVGTQDKCYKVKQLRIRNTHANPIIVPRV